MVKVIGSKMKNRVQILSIILSAFIIYSCIRAEVPTITTSEVTNIMGTTATCGGTITDDGAMNITANGVCWGVYPNPSTANSKTIEEYVERQFSSNISGLTGSTTYHVRAYATNSVGTGYGADKSFTTDLEYVEDIDGNVYVKVILGAQSWLRENLKVIRYNDGSPIGNITDNSEWGNSTIGAYCWYNNDPISNKETYGALYNWYAVSTRELCPSGWHVPSIAEWDALINYLRGEGEAGGKLKETGTEHWFSPNTGATNESGLTALPGGSRNNAGDYTNIGSSAAWWSSTEYDQNSVYVYSISSNNSIVLRNLDYKHNGFSVRCIKDK
jgi:uncharacterized protein (TIGR02145 family)